MGRLAEPDGALAVCDKAGLANKLTTTTASDAILRVIL
jgi:hypothetical protein